LNESEELTGCCRKLLNEELHDLYCSVKAPGIGKLGTGWAGHVACMEQVTKACNIYVRKLEGKG